MMNVQNVKVAALAVPQLKDNGAVTTVAVDTLGYDEALAIIAIGSTDIAMTALKMTESDDNSTYTDVSGADFTDADLYDVNFVGAHGLETAIGIDTAVNADKVRR